MNDDYSKRMEKTLEEQIKDEKLSDGAITYEEVINAKIKTTYPMPTIGGAPMDGHGIAVEQLKLKLFVQAIDYNKEICDLVFDIKNDNLRKEILDTDFAMLAIMAVKK